MEHLPIHLAYEAKLGGPVQYRWMYPFERFLYHLKKKIGNKACVEGSISEAYIIEETSIFCSMYFEPDFETRFTQVHRNDNIPHVEPMGRLSIFSYPGRSLGKGSSERNLTEEEYRVAHNYILLNCEEVVPYVEIFQI